MIDLSATALARPICQRCGEAIIRRRDERPGIWSRRRYCSVEHFQADEAEGQIGRPPRDSWPRPDDFWREAELYGDLRYEDVTPIAPPPIPAAIPLLR